MRISDWSSDVCRSEAGGDAAARTAYRRRALGGSGRPIGMPVRDAAVVLRADLRFDLASSKLRPVVSARGRLPVDVPLSQAIAAGSAATQRRPLDAEEPLASAVPDRKSTRLNSSH